MWYNTSGSKVVVRRNVQHSLVTTKGLKLETIPPSVVWSKGVENFHLSLVSNKGLKLKNVHPTLIRTKTGGKEVVVRELMERSSQKRPTGITQ